MSLGLALKLANAPLFKGGGGEPTWVLTSGETYGRYGDSTVLSATNQNTLNTFLSKTGELYSGVTVLNRGENGASLEAFASDGVTYGKTHLKTSGYQAASICFLINSVRIGGNPGETSADLIARLTALYIATIEDIITAVPALKLLIITPNSLGANDPGGTNYVTSTNAWAGMTLIQASQAASDAMWQICENVRLYARRRTLWRNVRFWDKMTAIYSRTVQTVGTLLADILHPVNTVAHAETVCLAEAAIIGYRAPFDQALSDAAHIANPAQPWLVYSRAIEDPTRYTKIVGMGLPYTGAKAGVWSNQAANSYIDFSNDAAANVHKLDYIQQAYGAGTWQIPNTATILQQNASITRILLPSGLPTFAQTGGTVRVFRPI